MRIVFMGSAGLAVPSLSALLKDRRAEVVGVVTQPDRPAGRRRRPAPCLLKAFAETQGLHILTPERVGDPDAVAELEQLRPDLFVVVAYGQYIPRRVIQLAQHEAVNLHPSLLPKYRGAAPIQWAIANGDTVTGVSIIALAERMDAGDIFRQETCPVEPEDTSATLHDRLAILGAGVLMKTLEDIRSGNAVRTVQDESKAVDIRKLSREDGEIDWTLPASVIRNRIRAFDPWPGSRCSLPDEQVLKVWQARLETASGQPGEVLDDQLLVAAGEQSLRLIEVQPAGKKRMPAAAFLNGHPLPAGSMLS